MLLLGKSRDEENFRKQKLKCYNFKYEFKDPF